MADIREQKEAFINRIQEYDHKKKLSETVGSDYYEPGMMENLAQYCGQVEDTGNYLLRVDIRGLRYENRSTRLKKCKTGDTLKIVRDEQNQYNSNNFNVELPDGFVMGTLPADLCNAIAPLYDLGYLEIIDSRISYIEQLLERSRYAKQGVMFVQLEIRLIGV